jgi:hypothetical protein
VAVAYSPDEPLWHHRLILSLLAAGDYDAARRARIDMLGRLGSTDKTSKALAVAWSAAVIPGEPDDPDHPVVLVERALKNNTEGYAIRVSPSVIQGAELYRAGRYAEAIEKLLRYEQWLGGQKGTRTPAETLDDAQARPLLAMAHHRLGQHEEARRWLDRSRDGRPDDANTPRRANDPDAFWEDLEIRLLVREAEAVILYDSIFPADPFAR